MNFKGMQSWQKRRLFYHIDLGFGDWDDIFNLHLYGVVSG